MLTGKIRPRDDQQTRSRYQRHRVEIRERVIAQRFPGSCRDDLAGCHDAERVAVFVGASHGFIADGSTGARSVLDDHRLVELVLHGLGEDAADDVGTPAGAERNDDSDGSLRPLLSTRLPSGHVHQESHCQVQRISLQRLALHAPGLAFSGRQHRPIHECGRGQLAEHRLQGRHRGAFSGGVQFPVTQGADRIADHAPSGKGCSTMADD